MQCMSRGLFKDPTVDVVPYQQIMSDYCKILDLDLVTMKKEEVEFSNFYEVSTLYNDQVHGFVVWFDTAFADLKHPVTLTTSPFMQTTHWKQSILYLDKPIRVRMGDKIYGSIAVRQDRKNFRELNIKMSVHTEPKHKTDRVTGKENKCFHFV